MDDAVLQISLCLRPGMTPNVSSWYDFTQHTNYVSQQRAQLFTQRLVQEWAPVNSDQLANEFLIDHLVDLGE